MSTQGRTGAGITDLASAYGYARTRIGHSDVLALGTVRRLDFQRFAIAVGDLNPIYFEEEAARVAGYPTVVAPPLFITSVMGWQAGPSEADLREDGLAERDSFLVSIPGLRLMGGGQEIELRAPVLDGTSVTMHRRLENVVHREGRSGPLILFTVRRDFIDQRGEVLASCDETFIGRWVE